MEVQEILAQLVEMVEKVELKVKEDVEHYLIMAEIALQLVLMG